MGFSGRDVRSKGPETKRHVPPDEPRTSTSRFAKNSPRKTGVNPAMIARFAQTLTPS
jgi:hypothetical protein